MQFLKSDILQLRALEPEDLPLLYEWENNSEWWEVGNTINPYSKYILREYIANSDKTIYELHQLRLMITLKESGITVGMADLFDFDPHNNRIALGLLIDKNYHRKGYAEETVQLLLPYCFDFLRIKTLYMHIPVDNTSSMKLFEKLNFEKTGILKSWIRKGDNYVDVAVWQKIKP
jgi:diamine N-acetyltransferase